MKDFGLKVLHVGAWGERTLVKSMTYNDYYQICDVKFVIRGDDGLKGNLHFSDQRIKKINPKTNQTPAFLEFLK